MNADEQPLEACTPSRPPPQHLFWCKRTPVVVWGLGILSYVCCHCCVLRLHQHW